MSIMLAPSAASCSAWATADFGSRNRPPSEKLSGVTLTMPISSGCCGNWSARVRSCQVFARCERSMPLMVAWWRSARENQLTDKGPRARDESLPGALHEPNNLLGQLLHGLILGGDVRLAVFWDVGSAGVHADELRRK